MRSYGKYRVSLKFNSSRLVCCRETNDTPLERRDFKLCNDIKTLPRSYSQMHLLYILNRGQSVTSLSAPPMSSTCLLFLLGPRLSICAMNLGIFKNQLCDAFGETWGHFPDADGFSPEFLKSLLWGGWCRHCIGEMSIVDVYFC